MQSLNLGILAHVDAGKTSLTERLLFASGIIDQLGSVDHGDTQTDTLPLERQRGITIKSAVAQFPVSEDRIVNLIDTPGHPDFIAEVERVLRILDGAVLVISAVEGVQPQTRVLMRALRRLRVPTLIFANKIDRAGAREEELLGEISRTLRLRIVPMGTTSALGSGAAEFHPRVADRTEGLSTLVEVLAEHDEEILASYVEGVRIPLRRIRATLRTQTANGLVHPVYLGSARTGAGVVSLMSGIAHLLPVRVAGGPDAEVSGTVFKIDRGVGREKIAYVRMFSGTLRVRDRLVYGRGQQDKVTAITTFDRQPGHRTTSVFGGDIARVWGLHEVQIGDRVGQVGVDDSDRQFPPPTMESVVEARDPSDRARLRVALGEMAEQDPLIRVRQDDNLDEISVSLYGEIQKEIVQATLAGDYGVDALFRETTTIYVERPLGTGEGLELLASDANPYMATVGLRIDPGPVASGVVFQLDIDQRSVPLYIYKTGEHFIDHLNQYVRLALMHGPHGWEVTDCVVTLNQCDYYVGDGPAKPNVAMARTTSADFRKLVPRVLVQALERAGTRVCEPIVRLSIETPQEAVGALINSVVRLGGLVDKTSNRYALSNIEATMPAERARELQRRLPALTGGEGNVETTFDGYQPVFGPAPVRGSSS